MTPPWICPHCRRYVPLHGESSIPHLDRSAPTPQLVVGQRVTALIDTDVCRVGQVGTVRATDFFAGRYDWTIWFDGGLMDYWNPCQVGLFLQPGPVPGQFAVPASATG